MLREWEKDKKIISKKRENKGALKKLWRKLVKKYHPDKHHNSLKPIVRKIFQELHP